MKYLISYRSEDKGHVNYGYEIAEDPIEWIQSVQVFREIYILLNAQLMTDEQIKKYDNFKGM